MQGWMGPQYGVFQVLPWRKQGGRVCCEETLMARLDWGDAISSSGQVQAAVEGETG